MNYYFCNKCGHVVISDIKPEPIKWTDGHVCFFQPEMYPGQAFRVSDQRAYEELLAKR